jgi:predicted aspartyl protease
MRGISVVLIVAALGVSGVASSSPHRSAARPLTVPFELYKGHIYVSVFVNGKGPYRFVFDTGASGMGRADVRLVDALSLKRIGQEQNSDGINVAQIDIVAADSLRLGDMERDNVALASRDYNRHRKPGEAPVMGIIGRDFFKDRLLTVDYPARTISFTSGRLRADQAGVVHYAPSFRIPVCFTIGCREGKVDTGSSESLVIPKALAENIAASPPVHVGSATSANTMFELYEMRLKQPVRISAVTARNQRVVYSEPSDDTINVGTGFLKDYVLTIDQPHQLLRISRPKR